MVDSLAVPVDNSDSSLVDLHEANAIWPAVLPVYTQLLVFAITQHSSSLAQSFLEHSLVARILSTLLSVSVDILSNSVSLLVLCFSQVLVVVGVLDVLEGFLLLYGSFGGCKGETLIVCFYLEFARVLPF